MSTSTFRATGMRHAGGPGSGNFGHEGRPGEVGGSAPGSAGESGPGPLPHEDALLNAIHTSGGFTYNPVTGDQPTTGFVVSTEKGHERVIPLETLTLADLRAYAWEKRDTLKLPGNHLGGWTSEGKLYLDISRVVSSRSEALKLGAQHNQLAIWDLGKMEEVRVTPEPVHHAARHSPETHAASHGSIHGPPDVRGHPGSLQGSDGPGSLAGGSGEGADPVGEGRGPGEGLSAAAVSTIGPDLDPRDPAAPGQLSSSAPKPQSLLDKVLIKLGLRSATPAAEGISANTLREDLFDALSVDVPAFAGVSDVFLETMTVVYITTAGPGGEFNWYMRSFLVGADDSITLGNDAQRVAPVTKFEAIPDTAPETRVPRSSPYGPGVAAATMPSPMGLSSSTPACGCKTQPTPTSLGVAMPTPNKNESQKDYVSRCIPIVLKDGTAKDNSQAAAICNSMFTKSQRGAAADLTGGPPAQGESMTPKSKELIGRLLASTATPFTEADAPILEKFPEARLEAMAAHCAAYETRAAAAPETPVTPTPAPVAAAPVAAPVAEVKTPTPEELEAQLPEETRSLIATARQAKADTRKALLETLAKEQEVFTAEQLAAKPTEELQQLAKLLDVDEPVPVDNKGRGLAVASTPALPQPYDAGLAQLRKQLGVA